MPSLLPPSKPRITTVELEQLMRKNGQSLPLTRERSPLLVVGIRGYYRDTMGAPGANDRCLYDDAIVLITDNVFAAFNGNTDPNGWKKGRGTGASKGMASLDVGTWPVYRFDLHKGQYLALCQRAGEVTVTRDGDPPYQDTGDFGINIHRGGNTGTSSLGCQTIPPSQWDSFITLATGEAKRLFGAKWRSQTITYCLVEVK